MICYEHTGKNIQKVQKDNDLKTKSSKSACTPGPHLMRIHLVRYSTSARYEKYSNVHLVQPIIHLVRIFALSTS